MDWGTKILLIAGMTVATIVGIAIYHYEDPKWLCTKSGGTWNPNNSTCTCPPGYGIGGGQCYPPGYVGPVSS